MLALEAKRMINREGQCKSCSLHRLHKNDLHIILFVGRKGKTWVISFYEIRTKLERRIQEDERSERILIEEQKNVKNSYERKQDYVEKEVHNQKDYKSEQENPPKRERNRRYDKSGKAR